MPAQRPSFKGEEKFDAQAARLRASLADQLSQIFADGGPVSDFGLSRMGKLRPEERSRLGKQLNRNQAGVREGLRGKAGDFSDSTRGALNDAVNRGFRNEQSAAKTAMAQDQATRQRADLSQIFGNVLQAGATGLSGLGAGALKEPELKQSKFDKFLGGAGKVFSAFGF